MAKIPKRLWSLRLLGGCSLFSRIRKIDAPARLTVARTDGLKLREGNDFIYDAQLHKLTIPFKGGTRVNVKAAVSVFNH
jgi:hypothetical protein